MTRRLLVWQEDRATKQDRRRAHLDGSARVERERGIAGLGSDRGHDALRNPSHPPALLMLQKTDFSFSSSCARYTVRLTVTLEELALGNGRASNKQT